jgi:hypothetical protein
MPRDHQQQTNDRANQKSYPEAPQSTRPPATASRLLERGFDDLELTHGLD